MSGPSRLLLVSSKTVAACICMCINLITSHYIGDNELRDKFLLQRNLKRALFICVKYFGAPFSFLYPSISIPALLKTSAVVFHTELTASFVCAFVSLLAVASSCMMKMPSEAPLGLAIISWPAADRNTGSTMNSAHSEVLLPKGCMQRMTPFKYHGISVPQLELTKPGAE